MASLANFKSNPRPTNRFAPTMFRYLEAALLSITVRPSSITPIFGCGLVGKPAISPGIPCHSVRVFVDEGEAVRWLMADYRV